MRKERRYHVYDSLLPTGTGVPAISFSEEATLEMVKDLAFSNEVSVPQFGRAYSIRSYHDAMTGDNFYVGGDFRGWERKARHGGA